VAVGALSAVGGLMASLTWDTPAGPSIVVVATVLFALGLVVAAVVRRRAG
jgi:zinc transport system permease protein